MLRAKISDIIACDLNVSYPLAKRYPPFDVLSVNFCVEIAAKDLKKFTQFLKDLRPLLNIDGFMGFFVSLEESFFFNQGTRYSHLYLTSEDVQRAFKESGFEVQRIRHLDIPLRAQLSKLNDCKALEHFVVRKLTEVPA